MTALRSSFSFPRIDKDPMAASDFDIDSLAKYLHLTPEQVKKMANRDRLPGRKIGGQWRFAKEEIHIWLEQKIGAANDNELHEVEKVLRQHDSDFDSLLIANLLGEDRVALPLHAKTKNSAIESMCEFAANSGALWMPKEMADSIRKREELHPTALENGVALLHPRRPQPSYFGESFLALGITSSGIPFGGPRGCLTDTFFLIASAEEVIHLKVLAKISRLIQKAGFLNELRHAGDPTEAFRLIKNAEQSL